MLIPEMPIPPPTPGSVAFVADMHDTDLSGSRLGAHYGVVWGEVVRATPTKVALQLDDGTMREVRTFD